LECIATTCSRRTIDQCIQEQTGQTLDRYGRMKVSAIQLIMDKYKYKYKKYGDSRSDEFDIFLFHGFS